MKKLFTLLCFLCVYLGNCQNTRITSVDFVQVLNDNIEETIYYYQNNWKVLRELAIKDDYIRSFEFLQTEWTEEQPFHFMLITTYANEEQFEKREENFDKLFEKLDGRKLLNNKQPREFRKILFSKEKSKHIFDLL